MDMEHKHEEIEEKHSSGDGHDHDSISEINEPTGWKAHWDLLLALLILIILLVLEYAFKVEIGNVPALIINGIAYILAGRKVLDLAFRKAKRGEFAW